MSDTSENTGADGIPEGGSDETPSGGVPASSGDEVRDEVKLDLDEDKLDGWQEVRDNYAVEPGEEMARPALTESEEDDADDHSPAGEDDEEDDLAEDDDDDEGVHEEE